MFEALVVTLREGIEAALVVGIIVIYLRKTGRESLVRAVWWGLGAGIAGSLVCAVIFAALGIQEEAYEGWLMIAGAILVVTLVVWMLRTSRSMKQTIEARVEAIAGRAAGGTGRNGAVLAGLFGLTFVLVLREGVETVLFLAAVDLTTDALLVFLAGLVGIALAVLFGVAFVRGTARVDLPRFFKVTAVVLFVLAAQLLIGGLHELGERGTIPLSSSEMRLIGPIVRNNVILLVPLLALPLIILLVPGRADRTRAKQAQELSGPDRRLALAGLRRERLWKRTFAVAGIAAIASLTVSYAFTRLPKGIDPPRMLEPDASGLVRVSTAEIADGRLHRFGVEVDGVVVRFIVKKAGARMVPVFDACQICGGHGYADVKGRLVCLACAADVNPATVGTGGGCNPIPLAHRLESGSLVVSVDDLRREAPVFRKALREPAAPPGS